LPSAAIAVQDSQAGPGLAIPGGPGLHPAISHALSSGPAALGERAEAVIRSLLRDRVADPSPDAWRSSRLTGDGFPFELAFSTADARVRFTLEPGMAKLHPRERLEVAIDAMRAAGSEPVPEEVAQHLGAMQAGAELAFGGWVGARVGLEETVFKLYAEIPPGAPAMRLVERPIALGDRTAVQRMVAYAPAARAFEWYLRVPSLEPRHLPAVLGPAGKEAEASRLLEIVADAYGHPITGRLPGPSVGVSYLSGRGAPTVTLHFYARALWGSDARIRRGFTRVAQQLGWDPEPYLEVTEPMATREDWRTFHGILGISLDRENGVSMTIGLRPVPW
jgi:hypothetical protein